MPKSKRYEKRKQQMAKDPEYRRRVLASQAASRARAVRDRHTAQALLGIVCPFEYGNGRHCWKTFKHTHGGQSYMAE